jgi:hypothetical protein
MQIIIRYNYNRVIIIRLNGAAAFGPSLSYYVTERPGLIVAECRATRCLQAVVSAKGRVLFYLK